MYNQMKVIFKGVNPDLIQKEIREYFKTKIDKLNK